MTTIGIFDSGVGGLSVLKELLRQIPDARYVYYADNANVPYGTKEPGFIKDRAREITRILISKGAQLIVVACNTATAAAISTLRAEFDLPIVGMEPAVKPAALGTKTGVIGVLATAGTLKGSKYLDIKSHYSDEVRILEHVGEGFVELVEAGELEGSKVKDICTESLLPLIEAGADRIVLGCTHYPFLRPVLEQIADDRAKEAGMAQSDIQFIDPAPAIAHRVLQLLPEISSDKTEKETARPEVELLSSGSDETLRKLFAKISYL